MDKPLSPQLSIIIPAYRMHTQNLMNVLDGISEKDALTRINGHTNHIIWMAGNFIDVRYGLGAILGLGEEDPHKELFYMGKALNENFKYPSLEELKQNFHSISPLVFDRLLTVTDVKLAEKFSMGMQIPFIDETVLNFIGMCIGREDYLCGQMGLMRRILGYSGMKYDVNNDLKY